MLPPPAIAAAEAPSMLAGASILSHSGSSPGGPAPDEPRLLRASHGALAQAVGPMAWHSSAPTDENPRTLETPPSGPRHAVAQFTAAAPAPLAPGMLPAPAKALIAPQAEAPKKAKVPSAHTMQMRRAVRAPSAAPADARRGASSAAASAGAPQPLMALPGGAAGAPASMPAVSAAGQIGNSTIAQPLQARSLAPDISEGTLALHGNGTLVHSSSLGLPPKGLRPIEGPVLGLAPEGQPFE